MFDHKCGESDIRSLEHLSLVIGAIGILHLLRHRLDLIDRVTHTDQIPPGDPIERVTSRANFSVHLVSSPNRRVIKGLEITLVRPGQRRGVEADFSDCHGGSFGEEVWDRGTVEMDVPCHRSNGRGGRSREGGARSKERGFWSGLRGGKSGGTSA